MSPSPFLQALQGNNRATVPVWFMRQAGRYLPSYQKLRSKHRFLDLCHEPELILKVTLLPVDELGVDAAILFADILLLFEALDRGLDFVDGKGPIIKAPVRNRRDIDSLRIPCLEDKLSYLFEGITLLKKELTVPLIGFCGAPFTLASYLIEGSSSRTLSRTKAWLYSDPVGFQALLDILTDLSVEYIRLQIRAGVQAFQIFDSWAHLLPPAFFQAFILPSLKKLLKPLREASIPCLLFTQGSQPRVLDLTTLSPDALSLHWSCSLPAIRSAFPKLPLQGNLDPCLLYDWHATEKESLKLLDAMRGDPAFIFGLGHGVLPDIPPLHLKKLVELVHAYRS